MKKPLIILAVLAASLCAAVAHAAGVDLRTFITPETAIALGAAGGMINFVQTGDILDLDPGATVPAGTGCLFGAALFGVAAVNGVSGVKSAFVVNGVVEIAKTSALAISVGDRLYWDATNKVVNKTATAQQHVGIAVEAAANPSSTVKMLLKNNVANAA